MKSAKILIAFTFLLACAVGISGQTLYPNELKGYKLVGNGKLKSLRIGISTRADVNKLFNSDCENECDYNQNWTVKFRYFSDESTYPLSYIAESDEKPNPKYTGKLFTIILMPKSVISFKNVRLPKILTGIGGIGVTASGGSGGSTDISSQSYRDSYGLEYQLLYETPLTKDGKKKLHDQTIRLESIEYGASNVLARRMFIRVN